MSSSPTESTLVEVTMPQMGISVAEGTILEWRKRAGDWVDDDETICEVTTDKVDVEIPAPASGRLERIIAEPGDTISVGEPIAEINTSARAGEAHPDEEAVSGKQEAEQPPPSGKSAPPNGELDRSGVYSPVVRRIAEEHHIDLSEVKGTGIGGRVRKQDVLDFVEQQPERKAEPALHTESPYQDESLVASRSSLEAEAQPPSDERLETRDETLRPAERREPMSIMRQQIAKHMIESRRTSAHCTTVVEVDFSRVAERRRELRDAMAQRGVNLTYLAFVASATVASLQEHPVLNASIEGDEIVYHDDVNLGIAVALDQGLIVPVIRRAQRLSLEGAAAAIGDLAERAREKRLDPDDVVGGTFTITNPGQFGAVLATPIINQPQVAILDLEAVVKRPIVVDEGGDDAIAVRPMSYLCMSWDHRALDGAQAARFLADLRERLESWRAE